MFLVIKRALEFFIFIFVVMTKVVVASELARTDLPESYPMLLEKQNVETEIARAYKHYTSEVSSSRTYGTFAENHSFMYISFLKEDTDKQFENNMLDIERNIQSGKEFMFFVNRLGAANFCNFIGEMCLSSTREHIKPNQIKVFAVDFPNKMDISAKHLEESLQSLMGDSMNYNVFVFCPYGLFSFYSELSNTLNFGINVGFLFSERDPSNKNQPSSEALKNILLFLRARWEVRNEIIKEGLYKSEKELLEKIGHVNYFDPKRPTKLNFIKNIITSIHPSRQIIMDMIVMNRFRIPIVIIVATCIICFYRAKNLSGVNAEWHISPHGAKKNA